MNSDLIEEKFGKRFSANEDTYHMGIHHELAHPIAERFSGYKRCLDACLGAGFMAIVLAEYLDTVVGVEKNAVHLQQARKNAKTAGVEKKIDFIERDVLNVLGEVNDIDCAFLDPDWAKKGDEKENHVSSLSKMVPPADVLFKEVSQKTKNICLRLPKGFDVSKLDNFPAHETEAVYQNDKLKFFCIYFGDLKKREDKTESRI